MPDFERPDEWEVYNRPDNVCIGFIRESAGAFTVSPIAGSPLVGVDAALRRSLSDAMHSIATKLMGNCKVAV